MVPSSREVGPKWSWISSISVSQHGSDNNHKGFANRCAEGRKRMLTDGRRELVSMKDEDFNGCPELKIQKCSEEGTVPIARNKMRNIKHTLEC